jgi:hypothetical protein
MFQSISIDQVDRGLKILVLRHILQINSARLKNYYYPFLSQEVITLYHSLFVVFSFSHISIDRLYLLK